MTEKNMMGGLGILLMIVGIAMIDSWNLINKQSIIGMIISTSGFLIYSFQNEIAKMK
jgi:hypothetical protein